MTARSSTAVAATGANGHYPIVVANNAEPRGCSGPGAQLYVDAYVPSQGRSCWSELADWPAAEIGLVLDWPELSG